MASFVKIDVDVLYLEWEWKQVKEQKWIVGETK